MRHDWIFDVLTDLRRYAVKNGMPELAARVDDALAAARAEVQREPVEPTEAAPTRPDRPH
jgi:hypothetical protein